MFTIKRKLHIFINYLFYLLFFLVGFLLGGGNIEKITDYINILF